MSKSTDKKTPAEFFGYHLEDDENDDIDMEIVNSLLEPYIPTPEDLARHMKYDELTELSRRVKCRVSMWRWNPVHDYAEKFRAQGRLQKKTPAQANALLAKAMNKYKAELAFTDDEIKLSRRNEWELRKKGNILRLNLWAYDRQQEQETNDQNEQIQDATNASNQLLDSIIDSDQLQISSIAEDSSSSYEVSILELDNTVISAPSTQTQSQNSPIPARAVSVAINNSGGSAINISISDRETFSPTFGQEIVIPASVVTASASQATLSQKSAATNLSADFMALNSETITFDSEILQHSEVEIPYSAPSDYTEFNQRISCTSTQSQADKF